MTDKTNNNIQLDLDKSIIGVIGLGYVGLPLAIEFGKSRSVIGFDINEDRISSLKNNFDETLEISENEILSAKHLVFSADRRELVKCDIFIITVPTPIDKYKKPNLDPLLDASKLVGSSVKKGGLIIYESTVFPGATEEECVPVLEKFSGLKFNSDFFVGYSPERINPGDRKHKLVNIKKVTSGSTEQVAQFVDNLYSSIIHAGTFKAESIKIAEAAKVIENTQRDLNIALVNELAMIFDLMGIDTDSVLRTAETKWNFLPFRPGLVGGHCIGVDPYYLTHKAEQLGHHPEVILAGRNINDKMGYFVVKKTIKKMVELGIKVNGSHILIMGFAFKENCPDFRNTRVIDVISEFTDYGIDVDVFDPWVNPGDVQEEYGISLQKIPSLGKYDVIILAVAHSKFKTLGVKAIRKYGAKKHLLFDLKSVFSMDETDLRL